MDSRPSLTHARRTRRTVGVVAALSALVTAVFAATGALTPLVSVPPGPVAPDAAAPWDFTVPAWDEALGGDQPLTGAAYADLASATDLPTEDALVVAPLARTVALAELTGQGRAQVARLPGLAGYWPPDATASGTCTGVEILAVSAMTLPVTSDVGRLAAMSDRFAKALVAYTGRCGPTEHTSTSPGIEYVYLAHTRDGWVAVRPWQVPYDPAFDLPPAGTAPFDWELAEITQCAGGTLVRARTAVVVAYEQMCAAAAADGVTWQATSGFRTRAEQAVLFEQAVEFYGSVEVARRHVAYADDLVCSSKHCSGLAVNISESAEVSAWLGATVGCIDGQGQVRAGDQCEPGETVVPNAARWGFATPLATSPGYLEFTLPIAVDGSSSLAQANCYPAGLPVANQVAAIFRCRLDRAGIVGPAQDTVVAEAVTVSRCESGWNPAAAAYGGRFATTPHPLTGRTFTHRGVFMIEEDRALDGWVVGGTAALVDPIANINAAASLWLTSGWELFGCATGDPGGFEAGPVLPQYGGPALPEWAFLY